MNSLASIKPGSTPLVTLLASALSSATTEATRSNPAELKAVAVQMFATVAGCEYHWPNSEHRLLLKRAIAEAKRLAFDFRDVRLLNELWQATTLNLAPSKDANWCWDSKAGVLKPMAGWEASIKLGKDYMVGRDGSLLQFISTHTSQLAPWMRYAFHWAVLHPAEVLVLKSRGKGRKVEWHVFARADFVEFQLPYHDSGGEHSYISIDCNTKVHVNAD